MVDNLTKSVIPGSETNMTSIVGTGNNAENFDDDEEFDVNENMGKNANIFEMQAMTGQVEANQ